MLVKCPRCREVIKENDRTDLDIVNGLTHGKCGAIEKVKDTGTYKEITERHPYIAMKYGA